MMFEIPNLVSVLFHDSYLSLHSVSASLLFKVRKLFTLKNQQHLGCAVDLSQHVQQVTLHDMPSRRRVSKMSEELSKRDGPKSRDIGQIDEENISEDGECKRHSLTLPTILPPLYHRLPLSSAANHRLFTFRFSLHLASSTLIRTSHSFSFPTQV
ncbi:hypothetical protein BLNAU_23555 [Blattamonas nauphoetae]|uniref:Uncharacterized protein n=1 Tax=Blattamonas nauphoetae TaxID=2049346 RepID=A0ABQ9WPX1_9EUKA|nr:hypothetical protein BLNAU_23555 [Blattamonas nauphoetae]